MLLKNCFIYCCTFLACSFTCSLLGCHLGTMTEVAMTGITVVVMIGEMEGIREAMTPGEIVAAAISTMTGGCHFFTSRSISFLSFPPKFNSKLLLCFLLSLCCNEFAEYQLKGGMPV